MQVFDDRRVEDRLAAVEIQPVATEVGPTLPFVPRRHRLIVATEKPRVKRRFHLSIAVPLEYREAGGRRLRIQRPPVRLRIRGSAGYGRHRVVHADRTRHVAAVTARWRRMTFKAAEGDGPEGLAPLPTLAMLCRGVNPTPRRT